MMTTLWPATFLNTVPHPHYLFLFNYTLKYTLGAQYLWSILEIWLWFSNISSQAVSQLQKQALQEVGLWRSINLVATQDMLLSISPFNKLFLVKLDLRAFFFSLMAPSGFGDHFACTFLSQNSRHSKMWTKDNMIKGPWLSSSPEPRKKMSQSHLWDHKISLLGRV